MSLADAAAGIDEQLAYLGGGGILFQSINEVPEILSRPPEEMRLAGLEAARRCELHKGVLSEAWEKAIGRSALAGP